jgi:hypothetical protein
LWGSGAKQYFIDSFLKQIVRQFKTFEESLVNVTFTEENIRKTVTASATLMRATGDGVEV